MGVAGPDDASERSPHAPPIDERPGTTPAPAVTRLHWIDWLRVTAIAGVFVYHSFRPFDSTDWHVKNAETNGLLGASQIFFATFGLAVLFLLAGAGVQFALRKRGRGAFLRERTARLLVPFVIGTLLLSPIQASIEAAREGTASSVLPDYASWWWGAPGTIVDGGVSPTIFGFGYHLWFLGFLFAFSVVGLPIFAALRRPRGTRLMAALGARVAALPGSTLLFALPIAVLIVVFAQFGTAEHDWAEFGWFFAYFVIGFVLLADERFVAAVRRDLWPAVTVGVVATAALIGLDFGDWFTDEAGRGDTLRTLVVVATWMLEGWALSLVVLNVGLRAPALQRPLAPRIGDAVLPVYVIHQPVILAIAFIVVEWPLGILPKWILIFSASLAITLALVELGLRGRLTRVLLGARAQRPGPAIAAQPAVAAQPVGTAGKTSRARPTAGARHA